MAPPLVKVRASLAIALAMVTGCIGKSAGEAPRSTPRGAEQPADEPTAKVAAAEPTANAAADEPAEVPTREPLERKAPAADLGSADAEQPESAALIETGDLVFADCASKHARALQELMPGDVNHVGIAFATAKGPEILAAEEILAQIPYAQWLRRCRPSRVVVKRLREAQTQLARDRLRPLQQFSVGARGRKYDLAFDFDDDDQLYSSEYVRKAYADGPDVELGTLQSLAQLGISAATVDAHNVRHETNVSRQTKVVSPASILADDDLTTVFDGKP